MGYSKTIKTIKETVTAEAPPPDTVKRMLRMSLLSDHVYTDISNHANTNHKALLKYRTHDFYSPDGSEHCRIFENDKEIVCAFSGTDESDKERANAHWKRNLNYGRRYPYKFGVPVMVPAPFEGEGKIHPGFAESLFGTNIDYKKLEPDSFVGKICQKCEDLQQGKKKPISFIGHSSGGAMAVLLASYIASHQPQLPLGEIHTFAAPRFAGKHFHEELRKHFPGNRYIRCELLNDPAPAWPLYEEEYYVHGGRQVVFTPEGELFPNCSETGYQNDTYSYAMAGVYSLIFRGRNFSERWAKPHRLPSYQKAIQTFKHGKHRLSVRKIGMDNSEKSPEEMAEATFRWSQTAYATIKEQLINNDGISEETRSECQQYLAIFKEVFTQYHTTDAKDEWMAEVSAVIATFYPMIEPHLDAETKELFANKLTTLSNYMNYIGKGLETVESRVNGK